MAYPDLFSDEAARTAPFNRFMTIDSEGLALTTLIGRVSQSRNAVGTPLDGGREVTNPLLKDAAVWRLDPITQKGALGLNHFYIVNRLSGMPLCLGPNGSGNLSELGMIDSQARFALIFEITRDFRAEKIAELSGQVTDREARLERCLAEYEEERANPGSKTHTTPKGGKISHLQYLLGEFFKESKRLETSRRDLSAALRNHDRRVQVKIVNARVYSGEEVYHTSYRGSGDENKGASSEIFVHVDKSGLRGVRAGTDAANVRAPTIELRPCEGAKPAGSKYSLTPEQESSVNAEVDAALAVVQSVASTAGTIFAMWSGVPTKTSKTLVGIATGLTSVGSVADIGSVFLNLVGMGEPPEDPVETLYKKMMPEIKKMIGEALVEDNVTDASANIRAASMAYRTASTAMALLAKEALDAEERADGDMAQAHARAIYDVLEHIERTRLTDLLTIADTGYRQGLAHLMIEKNARFGLSVFLPSAAEHITTLMLLSALYPSIDGRALPVSLKAYADHADRTLRALIEDRRNAIKDSTDPHLGEDNPLVSSTTYKNMHLPRLVEIDFGHPGAYAAAWRQIRAPLESPT